MGAGAALFHVKLMLVSMRVTGVAGGSGPAEVLGGKTVSRRRRAGLGRTRIGRLRLRRGRVCLNGVLYQLDRQPGVRCGPVRRGGRQQLSAFQGFAQGPIQ